MAPKKKSAKKATSKKASKAAKTSGKKKATKKAAAKPAATKVAKKAAVKVKTAGFPAVTKPRSKSQVVAALADATSLSKKEVAGVFEALTGLIKQDLKGPGLFSVPGLMKVKKIHKPKKPARKGINPFTGLETTFKAKPARDVVKVLPLKGLKDMV